MSNDRWEYHVRHSETPLTEEQLNELGAKGWELAAAMPTAGHYIFKRVSPDVRERTAPGQREDIAEEQADPVTE